MALAFEVADVGFERLESWRSVSSLLAGAEADPATEQYLYVAGRDSGHVTGSPFLDREAIVKVLETANPGMAGPPPEAIYVVAGQQATLLTGPLYTFLKAVTCIRVARELCVPGGVEVLPLFWIASEDHDVLEVNRVTVNGHRFVLPFEGPVRRGLMPQVADIPINEARELLLGFLEGCLPRTDFTPWVLQTVGSLDYSSYATAFRSMMAVLLGSYGLRVVEPIGLRNLTGPVLAELVERWRDLERALERGSQSLVDAGVEPPISALRLFEISGGCRLPVERAGDGLKLSSGVYSFEDVANQIRGEPQRFSPGAALRPLLQDAVLPVAVTVAGPTELAYLLQIAPLYEVVGLRPSLRYPRISATFLESGEQRVARKMRLSPARIFEALDMLSQPEEAGRDASAETIARKAEELLSLVDELPHSPPPRWLRSSRAAIDTAVSRILRRLQQERLEELGITRDRLRRIADAILPGGKLQERVANVTQFLNLHGPDFVRCTVEALCPHPPAHRVVTIGRANSQ